MSSQTLTLTNDLAEITRLAEAVEAFCTPLDPTPKDIYAIQLALEESVTNVINHGYSDGQSHTFSVELSLDGRRLTARVIDDAPAYDPLARPEVDVSKPLEERQIGGLGVHMVKKLMDSAHYERRDGRNILTLVRTFAAAA